ncbi:MULTISPECIES: hypothetical protein [Bacteroides]|jgi:hypothetical protein|uniref:hypothetical protein n=1 Tax=Bacteroides TaxID=816 RepID=UPI0008206DE3|nr:MULTISPECIES: hypothetical protein [Bacteroides]SCH22532.1 Uncharacterised protein [uncultured Bacteroides sp.]
MTIIDAIKKGLKAAGVNEKYAVKVQKLFKIEKEEDIDTYIALFKDNILPDLENTSAIEKAKKDAISEYEKSNGLKDGKPIKSAKKTKKTVKSEDDDEEDDKDEDEDFEGLPASVVKLLKAQQKQISELAASVSTVASTVTTSTKQASAKALFADSKLPAKWFNRIDVNSETSVEDQIKELQEEYAEIKQSVIDDEIAGGDYKPNSYKPKERTEQEWLKLMEDEESSDNGTASLGLEE